jgi:hypothetical protein
MRVRISWNLERSVEAFFVLHKGLELVLWTLGLDRYFNYVERHKDEAHSRQRTKLARYIEASEHRARRCIP